MFIKALEIDQNYETARINLGITLNEMGKFKEAVNQFEKIAETGQIK